MGAASDTRGGYQADINKSNEGEPAEKRLTCSDSSVSTPDVPFDCEALGLNTNPAASNTTIALDHEPLNFVRIELPSLPDVYCKLVSSRRRAQPATTAAAALAAVEGAPDNYTSAQDDSAATVVGTAVLVELEIGSLGLGSAGSSNVMLRGDINGFRVVAVSRQSGQDACAFDTGCPVRSVISCKWSGMKTNVRKRLVVHMVAADAGNHASVFAVRSAGAADMNLANNRVKLPYGLIAAL
ncbi:hypothetical protein COO60DRAFT_1633160 [Scenedesmus sp. NREL 46B-D3]|nr:hypothetical protein COO60DRAFT_1633160 [Scenedesmus sp. NREL 46B-D3]